MAAPSPAPPRVTTRTTTASNVPALSAEEVRLREVALGFSVGYYGMANHAHQNIPARPDSVLRTADEFLRWMRGEQVASIYTHVR